MVVEVLAAQVVDVGGGDQRTAELCGEAPHRLVDLLLLGEPVALDLEVDVLGAEDPDELVDVGPRVLRATLDDAPARARLQAAGQAEHAVGVALEQVEVDPGLALVEALEEAAARELDEVAVAGVGLGQQRQVVALDAAVAHRPVVDEVGLEAEQRLDVVLAAGLEELDRAVHDAVVGEAERRLTELRRAGREGIDVARAVEQRVLGVDVEVRAAGVAHGILEVRRRSGVPGAELAAPRCPRRSLGETGRDGAESALLRPATAREFGQGADAPTRACAAELPR